MFGHVKGAFTGAIHEKKGLFELADQGTIFLDEVEEMSLAMQAKLLRVLQDGAIRRVGSEKSIKVHSRVISATNKDLEAEVAAGRFRDDLFYRLCVVPITLPPLRERQEDIPLLSSYFLARFAQEPGLHEMILSSTARSRLMAYSWPGNVRELQNVLKFAMIRCQGTVIEPEHLTIPSSGVQSISGHTSKLREEEVVLALQRAHGNKRQAAQLLGVSRSTLYRFFGRQQRH